MASSLHETFASNDDIPLPSDRSVGWVFGGVALIVALVWNSTPWVWGPAAAIGLAFLTISFTVAGILRPLNIVWFKFGMLLNKIVSPVVMFVLFALTIVPAGFLMRLRYDPMRSKRLSGQDSYWIDRSEGSQSSMQNQF